MTLKEIARLAGASPSAVSRVLNNSGYVSAEKRAEIERVLAQYSHDVHRKNIPCTNIPKTVLVIADRLGVSDAYIDYIQGISECLDKAGYDMYLYLSGQRPQLETNQLLQAQKAGFAGVLMISAIESPALAKAIKKSKCPVVVLNRYLRGTEVDTVVLDNYKVGYLATQLLIAKGHRNIVHLAGLKDSTASQDRVRGFQDAMTEAGLSLSPNSIVYGNHSYSKGYDYGAMFKRTASDVTALFVSSDMMALGFIDAIYERGLHCPEDISIICTEDTKNLRSGKVRLTTIGYNNKVIGRTAAELFLERMKNRNGEKKSISYTPQIIERDSIRVLESNA